MLTRIKEKVAKGLIPKRVSSSHKGQNGRVLIIGGSIDYHGAPILSALGALHSGADLVYLYVPSCNFEVTRGMYPDFIVRKYDGDFFTSKDVQGALKLAEEVDSVLIGPGIGAREETLNAIKELVEKLSVPTVLDAEAISVLKMIRNFPLKQNIIITPYKGEFVELTDRDIEVNENDPTSTVVLRSIAMDLGIDIIVKGEVDYICSREGILELNESGNAGMTVGGTGDVLAGVVANFAGLQIEGFDAARAGAYFVGSAGDYLQKERGFCFSASDLAFALPYVI